MLLPGPAFLPLQGSVHSPGLPYLDWISTQQLKEQKREKKKVHRKGEDEKKDQKKDQKKEYKKANEMTVLEKQEE